MRQLISFATFMLVVLAATYTFAAATEVNETFSGSFPTMLSGTLANQNTVLLERLTLPANSNFSANSTSYATTALMGFSPNLILFSPSGLGIAASIPSGDVDAGTGLIGDARVTASNLPAGVYTLAVSDFLLNQSITATNLSDGFTSNFGSGTDFIDSNGNPRTGNYSVNVNVSAVPEPATFVLALCGFAFLPMRRR